MKLVLNFILIHLYWFFSDALLKRKRKLSTSSMPSSSSPIVSVKKPTESKGKSSTVKKKGAESKKSKSEKEKQEEYVKIIKKKFSNWISIISELIRTRMPNTSCPLSLNLNLLKRVNRNPRRQNLMTMMMMMKRWWPQLMIFKMTPTQILALRKFGLTKFENYLDNKSWTLFALN